MRDCLHRYLALPGSLVVFAVLVSGCSSNLDGSPQSVPQATLPPSTASEVSPVSPSIGTDKQKASSRTAAEPSITIFTRRKALLDGRWDRVAAEKVCDLLNEPMEASRASSLDDTELWKNLERLGPLGATDPTLVFFLREHPESAVLLAQSPDPFEMLSILNGNNYYPLFSIFSRLIDKDDRALLARNLASHANRDALAGLEARGYRGMEGLFLADLDPGVAAPYFGWLGEVVRDVLSESDDSRAARFLNFAVSQRSTIVDLCVSRPGFAEQLREPIWPRLKQVESRRPDSFQWLVMHPYIWDVLMLDHGKGASILCDWGPIGVDLLFGTHAYASDVRPIVVDALTQSGKEPLVHALWKLRQSHVSRSRTKVDDLLAMKIDEDLLMTALADVLGKPPEQFEARAAYLASLSRDHLHEDLRDSAGKSGFDLLRTAVAVGGFVVGGPVGAGIVLAYESGVTAKRAVAGREVRSQEYIRMGLAAASFAMAVDAANQTPDSQVPSSADAVPHKEMTLPNGTFIKIDGEAAKGLKLGEMMTNSLEKSAVTVGRGFQHQGHLNITGPLRLTLFTSGNAKATYDALSTKGVILLVEGSANTQVYFDLNPEFIVNQLGSTLAATARNGRKGSGEDAAQPTSMRDHEDAWRRNVSTWWYSNSVTNAPWCASSAGTQQPSPLHCPRRDRNGER